MYRGNEVRSHHSGPYLRIQDAAIDVARSGNIGGVSIAVVLRRGHVLCDGDAMTVG